MSPNSDSILSQELSRRTALKALFGAASAAVLFGLPTRAHAAEASKETTDKLNAAQAQLDEVQAQLDSIANEYAALANKNAQTLNDIENVQGKIDDTQAQIDEKKAELKKKRNDLSDRVAASYKSGGTNILSLLLASGCLRNSSPTRITLRRSTRATAMPSRISRRFRLSSTRRRPSSKHKRPTWRNSRTSRRLRCRICRPSSKKSRPC